MTILSGPADRRRRAYCGDRPAGHRTLHAGLHSRTRAFVVLGHGKQRGERAEHEKRGWRVYRAVQRCRRGRRSGDAGDVLDAVEDDQQRKGAGCRIQTGNDIPQNPLVTPGGKTRPFSLLYMRRGSTGSREGKWVSMPRTQYNYEGAPKAALPVELFIDIYRRIFFEMYFLPKAS